MAARESLQTSALDDPLRDTTRKSAAIDMTAATAAIT
jgi:hypothetical protein